MQDTMTTEKLIAELNEARTALRSLLAELGGKLNSSPITAILGGSQKIFRAEAYLSLLEFVAGNLDAVEDPAEAVKFAVGRGVERAWKLMADRRAVDPMWQVRLDANVEAALQFFELVGIKP